MYKENIMAKKKSYEFREKDYNRNSEGLRQRRLKDESRWKFNSNHESEEFLDDDEEGFWSDDRDSEERRF